MSAVTDRTPKDDPRGGEEGCPVRVAVASYPDMPAAERALERIEQGGVPSGAVELVGSGVRRDRRALGVRSYWDALRSSAGEGALFGAIIGVVLAALPLDSLRSTAFAFVLFSALTGVVLAALLAVLGQWGRRDREQAGPRPPVRASTFDLLVDERHESTARRAL